MCRYCQYCKYCSVVQLVISVLYSKKEKNVSNSYFGFVRFSVYYMYNTSTFIIISININIIMKHLIIVTCCHLEFSSSIVCCTGWNSDEEQYSRMAFPSCSKVLSFV